MFRETSENLINFIEKSPSAFHVIDNMKSELKDAGFEELKENKRWNIKKGGSYYVTRNDSSIIAFKVPVNDFIGFNIMSSHSDSPSFKIKENPEIKVDNKYVKLNVEKYGGMIMAPWFDRPLSCAGRIIVKEENKIKSINVDIDKDTFIIPNLAIHMNREVNEGYKFNAQKDMLPLFAGENIDIKFNDILADEAKVNKEDIIATDMFLYNRQKGSIWGVDEEFVSSTKLDDLGCAYCSLKGIINSSNDYAVTVHVVLDNEEVGSGTKQGAASTFLKDTLKRINSCLGKDEEDYKVALASSFMISADNAHAVHPNYADKTDPTNRPYLNGGVVIKHSANQKYTTDAVSCAIMKCICDKANVPYQMFVNRSDMAGGSTLGNISNTQVALNTVDIGVAQLAMHSPYETCGVKDTYYLLKTAEMFFNSRIIIDDDGVISLR